VLSIYGQLRHSCAVRPLNDPLGLQVGLAPKGKPEQTAMA